MSTPNYALVATCYADPSDYKQPHRDHVLVELDPNPHPDGRYLVSHVRAEILFEHSRCQRRTQAVALADELGYSFEVTAPYYFDLGKACRAFERGARRPRNADQWSAIRGFIWDAMSDALADGRLKADSQDHVFIRDRYHEAWHRADHARRVGLA